MQPGACLLSRGARRVGNLSLTAAPLGVDKHRGNETCRSGFPGSGRTGYLQHFQSSPKRKAKSSSFTENQNFLKLAGEFVREEEGVHRSDASQGQPESQVGGTCGRLRPLGPLGELLGELPGSSTLMPFAGCSAFVL